jgi:hypothetical protein
MLLILKTGIPKIQNLHNKVLAEKFCHKKLLQVPKMYGGLAINFLGAFCH